VPAIPDFITSAQYVICTASYGLGRFQDAVTAADAVLAGHPAGEARGDVVAPMLMVKSRCFARNRLDRRDLQLAALDRVLTDFGGDEPPRVRFCVADAMFEKGRVLDDLGESAEAQRLFGRIFDRFADDPPADARPDSSARSAPD
jgi:hypothetical protein